MKNLLTFLLLVMSLLAFGQSNSRSIEIEIQFWKSIAESNDTVAYREYLQRYGEDGLYKDEALTRIALLKTSRKQTQSNNIECCFYSQNGPYNAEYVVRFDAEQSKKIWIKLIDYYKVRDNLAMSRNYYESQAAVAMTHDLYEKVKKFPIIGKITLNNMKDNDNPSIYITATHTTSGEQYYSSFDKNGNYNYYLSIPPGGPYEIKYRMHYGWLNGCFKTVAIKNITVTLSETKIINAVLDKKSIGQVEVEADSIPHHKNAWTTDEEYQYDPMKSTSARDVYFKRDNLHIIDCYITYSYDYEKLLGKKHDSYKSYEYDDEYDEKHYKNGDSNDGYHYSNNTKVGVQAMNDPAYHYSYNIKTMQGYRYVAFSKDKSSIIMWFEEDNKYNNGKIQNKKEYKRESKEEFLPKAVNNYDFLNE